MLYVLEALTGVILNEQSITFLTPFNNQPYLVCEVLILTPCVEDNSELIRDVDVDIGPVVVVLDQDVIEHTKV